VQAHFRLYSCWSKVRGVQQVTGTTWLVGQDRSCEFGFFRKTPIWAL
jgi:hypothetical protein